MIGLVVIAVSVFLWLAVVFLLWRGQAEPGTWPAASEIGLSVPAAVATTVGLCVAGLLAVMTRRRAASSSAWLTRGGLLAALILGGLFIAWQVHEYRTLYAVGVWQHGSAVSPHDFPDIYYVQAVRLRLLDLSRKLDDVRVNHPDQFTSATAENLELVTNLQTNLIGWTEQQVGHWLDDISQHRAVMHIVAYLVHPLPREKSVVESAVQQESRQYSQRRQWFSLLREYCEQKDALHAPQSSTSSNNRAAQDGTGSDTALDPKSTSAAQSDIDSAAEIDDALRQKLKSLGLEDWAFAQRDGRHYKRSHDQRTA